MLLKWLPWKWLVGRAARSYGLLDPFMLLARLRRFAEPSEVDAPLELIRAWTVFQARGVVNTRAIQHNLDWVWPYWVERQFNPRDISFVPRSFMPSHINLTHRNWTAVSLPDVDAYCLVDPRGLVTPFPQAWSLDAWLLTGGRRLVPSQSLAVRQRLCFEGELAVETEISLGSGRLQSRVEMQRDGDSEPLVQVSWTTAGTDETSVLCVALRPYNPEGIQFIDRVDVLPGGMGWRVNGKTPVSFNRRPQSLLASDYKSGDVFHDIGRQRDNGSCEGRCPVGMATAVALFPLEEAESADITVRIPCGRDSSEGRVTAPVLRSRSSWKELDSRTPVFEVPDSRLVYLFKTSVRTLLSLSAGEVYPGSFTYRRFWFRDACLMLNALLALNHDECCRRALEDSFVRRQTWSGFFESQQGEWDSNGQVLWLAELYQLRTGRRLPDFVIKRLLRAGRWICRKRLPEGASGVRAGLLPPGFSAEHLGPNNYYYWDNFWGVAGLESLARILRRRGSEREAELFSAEARGFRRAVMASIEGVSDAALGAIPAAPGRRMDAGAVGSLAADYPLRLFPPGSERVMKTVEFLFSNCLIDNGFFHDMTHSGINPYLTLHLAQVLMRAGDPRYRPLLYRVAELASPTGQWPEAIHPLTGGGCMGDGQHGWAAAEWALMIRNMFVREESDRLIIGAGLLPEWLESGECLRFGPTATRFGPVSVEVVGGGKAPRLRLAGEWFRQSPPVETAGVAADADVEVVS